MELEERLNTNPSTILSEGYVIASKEPIQVTGYRGSGPESRIVA